MLSVQNYQGMELVHDYRGTFQETLSVVGPTTAALQVSVFLVLDPGVYGPIVAADIAWSYSLPTEWVRTPCPCSVTCETGE